MPSSWVCSLSRFYQGVGTEIQTEGRQTTQAGLGTNRVSDGGFGASLRIDLEDGSNEIGVTDRKGFFVTAVDLELL